MAPRQHAVAPIRGRGQPLSAPKQHTALETRIRPNEPKVPFGRPLKTAIADGSGTLPARAEKHGGHHGFLGFFKSRHKGPQRIVTFLLLPLAILLTCALIFVILKIL